MYSLIDKKGEIQKWNEKKVNINIYMMVVVT